MKNRKIIGLALLFIAAISLFVWGINFMKGKNIFSTERIFYAVYDKTAGLNINNPVIINGHQVGLVRNIKFLEGDPKARLIVKMGIKEKLIIPADSRAVIETNLLGSNIINIQFGHSPLPLQNHDTLLSAVGTTLQEQFSLEMLPVKKKAENVMLSLDTVLTVIRYVFNEETRLNLTMAMENIRRSIDNLKNTTYNIDTLVSSQKNKLSQIFSNVESITKNFENNNQTITSIIHNLNNISDTLARIQFAKTIQNADKAISDFSEVIAKINEGEGSMAQLINNRNLYDQLEKASKELNELLYDIKYHPNRYLQFSILGGNKKKNTYSPPPEE